MKNLTFNIFIRGLGKGCLGLWDIKFGYFFVSFKINKLNNYL